MVRDTIDDYNFNNLNKFDGVFRHSQLLKAIDSADPSIQNSTVRPFMHKTITPLATTALNNHTLNFTGAFYVSGSTKDSVISSTAFKINGVDHYFGDEEGEGQTARRVYVYKLVNGVEVKAISDCGTVTTATGQVILNNFVPTNADGTFSNTDIKITIKPDSLDIAPKRNQLLNIDPGRVVVAAQVDTITTAGSSGSIDYTVNSRLR